MSKRVSRFRKTKAEGAKGLAGEQMARRLGGSQVDGGVGYGLPQKAAHVPPDPICFDHFAHAGFHSSGGFRAAPLDLQQPLGRHPVLEQRFVAEVIIRCERFRVDAGLRACQCTQGGRSSFMTMEPFTWLSNGPSPRVASSKAWWDIGPEERPIQPLVVVEDLVGGIPADHLQKGAVLRRMYRRAGGDEQRELAPAARDGKAKGPPKVSVSGVQAMWPPSATRKTNWSGSASGVPARASIAYLPKGERKGLPGAQQTAERIRQASQPRHRPRLRINPSTRRYSVLVRRLRRNRVRRSCRS